MSGLVVILIHVGLHFLHFISVLAFCCLTFSKGELDKLVSDLGTAQASSSDAVWEITLGKDFLSLFLMQSFLHAILELSLVLWLLAFLLLLASINWVVIGLDDLVDGKGSVNGFVLTAAGCCHWWLTGCRPGPCGLCDFLSRRYPWKRERRVLSAHFLVFCCALWDWSLVDLKDLRVLSCSWKLPTILH